MSKISFSTSSNEKKQAYEEKLYRRNVADTYWNKLSGKSMTSAVWVKEDLTKQRGDSIRFGFVDEIEGGVTDGEILEGQEQSISSYTQDITLSQYRNALRDDGALSRQRTFFSITDEAESLISEWGKKKIDQLHFDALLATPTHVAYVNNSTGFDVTTAATAKANLHATGSKLTPSLLTKVRTWAVTGGNDTIVPIRPLMIDGEEFFVLVVPEDVKADLELDATFAAAQRDAQERGKKNPIFKNATLVWGGVIVHSHRRMPLATDGGGASVPWAKCALLGQSALQCAWGRRPKFIKKNFDYENEEAWAYDMILKVQKAQFNSADYGSMGVYVSRTQVSDA